MTTPTIRMLRLPQVTSITGLGRDSIYRLGHTGAFPRPRKLGERASGWREDEVRKWIESRPVAGSQLAPHPTPARSGKGMSAADLARAATGGERSGTPSTARKVTR